MINSGTDIQQLAYQFVQTERASQDRIYRTRESNYDALMKSYRAIKSDVNDLRSLLTDLTDRSKLEEYSVTTSEEGFATITAGANATPGEYQINIEQLARADQVSLAFASETDPMPTSGTMTLGVGADSFTIDMSTLGAGATLADLRDAINSDTNNPGVQASIVRSNGSVQLMISAENTGAANTLSMTTDGSAEMANIQAAMDSKTVISTAQDSIINLGGAGGLRITNDSNRLENVIDGLTIDLDKAHATGTETLTFSVGQDDEATAESLQGFVDKFNAVMKSAGGKEDSPISSDSTAKMIIRQLKSEISGYGIGQLGVEFTRTGTLTLDKKQLTEFLQDNPDGLTQVLGGAGGVLEQLNDRLKSYVRGENALINTSTESLQSRMNRLDDSMERFDRRMQNRMDLYISQFSEMQAAITQMNQTQGLF